MSKLRHNKITALFAVCEQNDHLFLVMEYIRLGELFDRIVQHKLAPYTR